MRERNTNIIVRKLSTILPPTTILSYLCLFISILAISLGIFFIRWAEVPGPVSATYRMGLALFFQLPYFIFLKRRPAVRPEKKQSGYALLAGGSMGLNLVLWSTAVLKTKVANASLLTNSAPIFVAMFSWLILRTRLNRLFWLGLVLAIFGMAVVIGMDFIFEPSLSQGNLLALASAIFYAAYYLLVARSRQGMGTFNTVLLIELGATVVLGTYCVVANLPLKGFSSHTWLMFCLNALITQVVGYLAMTYALGHLPAWIISPTMILQPVLTALLAIPIMGEALRWNQIVGGIIVVAGIYIVNRTINARGATKEESLQNPAPNITGG